MKEIITAIMLSLVFLPSVMALNLTYGECTTIGNTTICSPTMNNYTFTFENCSRAFNDNYTSAMNNVSSFLSAFRAEVNNSFSVMSNTMNTSMSGVTSKFVTDCLDWKVQLRDVNTRLETMDDTSRNLSLTREELGQCKASVTNMNDLNNNLVTQNQTCAVEYYKVKDMPNIYGLFGFAVGAGIIWWYTHRKKHPDYHGKEGYTQAEGGRLPVRGEDLKPRAESMP